MLVWPLLSTSTEFLINKVASAYLVTYSLLMFVPEIQISRKLDQSYFFTENLLYHMKNLFFVEEKWNHQNTFHFTSFHQLHLQEIP